jgi:uncharacterized membrane protein YfcA
VYELLKISGFIFRQFVLPNPFETICPDYAFVINLILGAILIPVSYIIVGSFYDRYRDGAAFGSLMFNVVYIILTFIILGVLTLAKLIADNWIVILCCAFSVIIVFIAFVILYKKRKFSKERTIEDSAMKDKENQESGA